MPASVPYIWKTSMCHTKSSVSTVTVFLGRKKNNVPVRPGSKVKHSKARAQHGLVQELKIGLGVFTFVQ